MEDKEFTIRRKNRRRMAWTSLVTMIVISFLLMFVVRENRINLLSNFLETFFICLSSIVLGYLGFATMDDNNVMKNKNPLAKELLKENKEDKE